MQTLKNFRLSRLAVLATAVATLGLGGCVAYPNYAGQPYQAQGTYVQTPVAYPSDYSGYGTYRGNSGGYGGNPYAQQPYQGQYNTYDGYGRPVYQQQPQYYQQPQQYYQQPQQYSRPCSSLNAGALVGAAGGGLLGSTIGRGNGRLAGVGAGALLGGLAGSSIQNNANGCN